MKIAALDVGERTVGVAVSDALEITANPRTVLRRDGSELDRLAEWAADEGVELIVVGLPYTLRGEIGPQAKKVLEFVEALRIRLDLPIETWDERFTTAEAEQRLIEAERGRAERRRVIDQLAATIILESYLEERARNRAKHQPCAGANSG